MIRQFKNDLKIVFPTDLVEALLDSYVEIKTNFIIDKWEPAELNGGKFVEATIRILQFACFGTHTPIGTSIRNTFAELQRIEQSPSKNRALMKEDFGTTSFAIGLKLF